jgi:hypothetical protein
VPVDWSEHFRGKTALLATMHGKEAAIAPVLADGLRLATEVIVGLDTDQFGSFSREVLRTAGPIEAARAKIIAALSLRPELTIGVASEGSFGPHPEMPIVPLGRELVLLVDRESGLELWGEDHTVDTNYAHAVVSGVDEALAFARACGFPEHGVIVSACADDLPQPQLGVAKQIESKSDLIAAVRQFVDRSGCAFVEADMRAHRNPQRMRAIGRATSSLVEQFSSRCSRCGTPGFRVAAVRRGLPCALCAMPTHQIAAKTSRCSFCGLEEELPVKLEAADPGSCQHCNP